MKRILTAALLCGGILSPAALSSKETPKSEAGNAPRSITLFSESWAKAKPEAGRVVLYFSGYGWTVDKARGKADETVKKFLDKLAKEKISPSQVQVGDAKLKPSYLFNRDLKASVPSDFLVSRKVTLVYDDPDAIAKIMDVSLSLGSFLLESVQLTVKDPAALLTRSFQDAIEDGKTKAEAIAKAQNLALGELIGAEEIQSELQEVNVLQETDFAMLAAAQLNGKDKSPGELPSSEPSNGATGADPLSKSPSDSIVARTRLKLTFALR